MREAALKTARQLVGEHFPNCITAILGGSIIRGEGTDHSDLDIFIVDPMLQKPYRESLIYNGFPVEVFVHTLQFYKEFFKNDCDRARPSLPQMVFEGEVIVQHDLTNSIIQEAKALLEAGPAPWSEEKLQMARYGLTDLLDDFEGSKRADEDLFIAGCLAEKIHEFYLRMNNQWIGSSKWILRALRRYNPEFAEQFTDAFQIFYKTGEKSAVIELVEDVLEPYGGKLFEGYSSGKEMET